jgi:hypothetical protein
LGAGGSEPLRGRAWFTGSVCAKLLLLVCWLDAGQMDVGRDASKTCNMVLNL